MRVLQTIQGMASSSGGPSTCTRDLMDGLWNCCAHSADVVDLLTFKAPSGEENLGFGKPWLKEVPADCWSPLCISSNAGKYLGTADYNIYHANALWMYINHATCKAARKKGKPYIISPHGMLYPTALNIKYWKKWPMLKLWFERDIHSASCLHATCIQEMNYCRDFGYKGPIAVIPNAVVFPEGVELKSAVTEINGRRQLGFLGRLHPIKKVENLLYAIALLSKSEQDRLSLQIMGKYDDSYEAWLKTEVSRLDIEDCVDFVGFVSGKEKYDRLSRLCALMVPSTQENFGMIVPESLICGTPVYASLGTPWEELNHCDAGWWADNEPATIAKIMQEILSLSEDRLLEKGQNGRKLIENKYEQSKVASMMLQLYHWLNGDGIKPEFVYE